MLLTRPGTLCPPPTPHALRDEYTRTIAPARALAAETLTLERTLSDLAMRLSSSQHALAGGPAGRLNAPPRSEGETRVRALALLTPTATVLQTFESPLDS